MRHAHKLQELIDRSKLVRPIRVAVVNAAQSVLLETLREAIDLGFVEPTLIGESKAICDLAALAGIRDAADRVIEAKSDPAAASSGVALVRPSRPGALRHPGRARGFTAGSRRAAA